MKTSYISVSTDILHGGHIEIINKAARYGELTVGVLTDEVVAGYKRYPILSLAERMKIFRGLTGVKNVIEQTSLSGVENIKRLKPDFVIHGDDWKQGLQQPIRKQVIDALEEYGGKLIEFPYSYNPAYDKIENQARMQLSIPDIRRGRLKEILALKPLLTAIEVHSGLTGLIAEETKVNQNGGVRQFDAMWISSLCDSTAKGKPDIELVDFTSRLQTIDDVMEVTTKPIIFDADTGGEPEHFAYIMRTLERVGVSAAIVEDKVGLKRNSLFGTEASQTQDTIENFIHKIQTGKNALKTKNTMIIARIESLILQQGMEDALNRARSYSDGGADGIMIHSCQKTPDEIIEFCDEFRKTHPAVPIVVVPSTYSSVTEEELAKHGVNIVIYANQLTRSAVPAMQKTAECILNNHRALEADELCMPIKEIIRLIPEI